MKGYFFSIAVFLLPLAISNHSSVSIRRQMVPKLKPRNQTRVFTRSLPGNYWVYTDSAFSGGKLLSVTNDTDKIVSESMWNGKKTYLFDDNREWVGSGDTIYLLTMQRTQVKYPTPMIIAAANSSYNYAYGGDVVMQRNVTQLSSCPQNKWGSKSATKSLMPCQGYLVVGAGVGILKERTMDCSSGNENYTIRTLVDAHLK
jgi:hypothetical protein